MPKATFQTLSFIAVVVLVTAAFVWLLLPYYGAILWAVVLAVLFNPIHRRLLGRLSGRRNFAAALSVLGCICIGIVPASLVLAALAHEAAGLYLRITLHEFDPAVILARAQGALPRFLLTATSKLNLGDLNEAEARLTSFLLQASQGFAERAVVVGQNTAQLLVSLGIMVYLLFFLFRDGSTLTDILRKASPLDARHTDHILGKFASVMKATVMGNVVIAAIEGGIGGTTFWALGIDAALLWGLLMAALSLLPAIGTALVWVPVGGYFLLSGDYLKGVILLIGGVLVISLVNSLIRPPVVGKGTRLPDYVVLISTAGGLSLIGMNGFVIGPLIAALFVAVWSLFADDQLRP